MLAPQLRGVSACTGSLHLIAAIGPRGTMSGVIVHLLGWPGVGKLTVARAIASRAATYGAAFVVVDNHLTSLPVLEVVSADRVRPLPSGVWDLVGEIREVVYRAIEVLSSPDSSFVFTNVLVESEPRSEAVVDRLRGIALARSRGMYP